VIKPRSGHTLVVT